MTRRRKPRKNETIEAVDGKTPPAEPSPARSGTSRVPYREWAVLGVILLVGTALHLAYFGELSRKPDFDSPLSDARFNDYWARAMVTGDWTPPEGEADPEIRKSAYFRPPGYPYFLALTYAISGGSYWAPRAAQMLLSLVTCALVFLFGRRLFGGGAGLAAAAVAACYWARPYYDGEFQPVALLAFLTMTLLNAAWWWSARPSLPRAGLVGVLIGLFAIVRPNVLLCVPFLAGWCIWVHLRRSTGRRAPATLGAAAVAMLVPILPVTIRNYAVSGDFVLISTNAGVNLYIGNNPQASLTVPRIPDIASLSGRTGWSLFSYAEIARGVERQIGGPLTGGQVSKYFSKRAIDFMKSNPTRALQNASRRLLLMWGPSEVSNNKQIEYERSHSSVLRWLLRFPFIVSGSLIGLALWIIDRRRRRLDPGDAAPRTTHEAVVLAVLFVAVYSSSFLPFLVAGRFRAPYIPLLAVFVGYAAWRIILWLRARNAATAALGVVAWAAIGAAACVPYERYDADLGAWHLDRATAYRAKDDLDNAIRECRAAVEASPRYRDSYAALASLYEQAYRFSDAIAWYRKALELSPGFIEARRGLAELLVERGRDDEAIVEYRQLLGQLPEDTELAYTVAQLLVKTGRKDEAMTLYRRIVKNDATHYESRVNLGILLQEVGDVDGAMTLFRKAIEIDPSRLEAHYNLAGALYSRQQLEEAMYHLREAERADPTHPEVQRVLRILSEQKGGPRW